MHIFICDCIKAIWGSGVCKIYKNIARSVPLKNNFVSNIYIKIRRIIRIFIKNSNRVVTILKARESEGIQLVSEKLGIFVRTLT